MINQFPSKVVTSFCKQYQTAGHSPHLVITQDFCQYILKSPNNPNDKSSITKEFLCNQLLQLWKILVPDAVCLKIETSILESGLLINNKPLNNTEWHFGSSFIPNSIDLQKLITGSKKVSNRKIENLEAIFEIALFDIWVENDDRKPSNNNIILSPYGGFFKILPIDHAYTFSSISIDSLDPEYVCFSDNDSIINSPFGLSVVKQVKISNGWLTKIEKKFYICTKLAEVNFQQICDNLPDYYKLSIKEIDCLREFLFNPKRIKNVFEQFRFIVSTAK